MGYRFEFRPYRRQFKRPLQTSHGNWDIREGIILRLSHEGQVSWGEIAPISWFGSETLEQSLDFCHQLPTEITSETIFSIPATLPACQFGFESALSLPCPLIPLPPIPLSGLLAAGEAALNQWEILWNQGYRTFKWKIGVAPMQAELKIFHQLVQALPASAQLRLDANGGLSYSEANEWLRACDRVSQPLVLPLRANRVSTELARVKPRSYRRNAEQAQRKPRSCLRRNVEFLEQPLPVAQFDAMLELSDRYSTPLALDESVATLEQLEASYQRGWRGVFVIKPCIAGSPSRLRQFCSEHEIDAVFSSVFETTVGRLAALKLAVELSRYNRAVGFGIDCWFDEDDETWLEQLWKGH